jgi:hypothetical protein
MHLRHAAAGARPEQEKNLHSQAGDLLLLLLLVNCPDVAGAAGGIS